MASSFKRAQAIIASESHANVRRGSFSDAAAFPSTLERFLPRSIAQTKRRLHLAVNQQACLPSGNANRSRLRSISRKARGPLERRTLPRAALRCGTRAQSAGKSQHACGLSRASTDFSRPRGESWQPPLLNHPASPGREFFFISFLFRR